MAATRRPILAHVELEGERIAMRPLAASDADVAFPLIYRREPILEWLVWQGPKDLDELRERFGVWRGRTDSGRSYRLAILDRETGAFVGTMGLRVFDRLFQVELGYWLAEKVWGRGFATEAVWLADWLAFQHLSATVVTAEVFVGNHGSCRVLERNGFVRERSVRRVPELPVGARGHERWIYTLTRGDFLREHSANEPRLAHVELT